jgi:hypothetical protein
MPRVEQSRTRQPRNLKLSEQWSLETSGFNTDDNIGVVNEPLMVVIELFLTFPLQGHLKDLPGSLSKSSVSIRLSFP